MSTVDGGQQVSRPLQIVLGVVIGLAALYALWAFVVSPLLNGDDPAPDVVAEQPLGDDGDNNAPAPAPSGGQEGPGRLLGDPVPETYQIFTARDPFQQLVVIAGDDEAADVAATGTQQPVDEGTAPPAPVATAQPGTSGSSASGTGGSSSGATGSGSSSAAPESEEITAGPESDDAGDLSEQSARGPGGVYEPTQTEAPTTLVTVQQVDLVPEERLTVRIDDVAHDVAEGEVFADRFQLLDISGRCATMLFGDSRFTLCEGESVTK